MKLIGFSTLDPQVASPLLLTFLSVLMAEIVDASLCEARIREAGPEVKPIFFLDDSTTLFDQR